MFIPVFGRKRQIHYLLGKLNEFHICDTTFSSMSGRPLEKFYSKVTLIQDIFWLFWAKLLFCIHNLEEVARMICCHRFLFICLMRRLICWRAEESVVDDFSSDEFYEVLEQFKVQSLVTKSNAKINLLRNLN